MKYISELKQLSSFMIIKMIILVIFYIFLTANKLHKIIIDPTNIYCVCKG